MEQMKFKVDGEEQSKRLQDVLYELGYSWGDLSSKYDFADMPYIYTLATGNILYTNSDSADFFNDDNSTQYDTEEFIEKHTQPAKEKIERKISVGELVDRLGTPNARDILLKGAEALDERATERDHQANGERSMKRCVDAFNGLTGHNLTTQEGWIFMVQLKLARGLNGKFRMDDYVDAAAYSALAGEEGAQK